MPITQTKEGWQVRSQSGRNLGTYRSYVDANNREKEVLIFKRMKENK